MKPNYLIVALLSLALCNCKAGVEPDFETDVKVIIRDEIGDPVEGAKVELLFSHFDEKKNAKYVINTDEKGSGRASEKVVSSLLLRAEKQGFYPLRYERVLIRMDVDWEKIKNIELPLVMRRIKQPVSLYAKKFSAIVPDYEKPISFDFEAGDWVAPFGIGKSSDIVFSYNKKFVGYRFEGSQLEEMRDFSKKSYAVNGESWSEDKFKLAAGKWNTEITISFPNPLEGVSNAKKDYCHYSQLTLPHEAYREGYSKALHLETDNHTPKNTPPDPAYFVRTRVILDEKGEITSANYAKITSPIQFDPRGRLEFTYVFNPTPNDRNLEFDISRNLFTGIKFEERVLQP